MYIPTWMWEGVNMDFSAGFPRTRTQHDFIWEIIYRFTISDHFCPMKVTFFTKDYAKLCIKGILKSYWVPLPIISDQGTQFTCHF